MAASPPRIWYSADPHMVSRRAMPPVYDKTKALPFMAEGLLIVERRV